MAQEYGSPIEQASEQDYIVTMRSNPDALPFVLGSGGFWHAVASSPEEAIEKVASHFWEPMREQTKSELIAYPTPPSRKSWQRPACEMSREEAASLNASYCFPAIDA